MAPAYIRPICWGMNWTRPSIWMLPWLGTKLAGEQAEEGALADAVDADEGGVLPVADAEGDAAEEQVAAGVDEFEVLNDDRHVCSHRGRLGGSVREIADETSPPGHHAYHGPLRGANIGYADIPTPRPLRRGEGRRGRAATVFWCQEWSRVDRCTLPLT